MYLLRILPFKSLKHAFSYDQEKMMFYFKFTFIPFIHKGIFSSLIRGPSSALNDLPSGSNKTAYLGSYLLVKLNLNMKHPSIPPVMSMEVSSQKNAKLTSLTLSGTQPTKTRCSLKMCILKSVEMAR